MTSAIFGQAIREYLRPRRLAPWILLSGICLLLAFVWPQLDRTSKPMDQYAVVSSLLVFRLLALASAIFTTAIVTQEVEQRTIVYLLTRPVPRWILLSVRYIASVIVVGALAVFAALLTSFGAYKGGFLGNPLLMKDLIALLFGAFAYGAVFLFFSLLFNRALIVCLLFAFGWEAFLPNMPGQLNRLSVLSYLQGISQHPGEESSGIMGLLMGTLGPNTLSPQTSYISLAVMVVVLLGLSAWWFTHFEFVPREDAE